MISCIHENDCFALFFVFVLQRLNAPSDTQGWFRSLHRPLGQLVEFPWIYRWTNTIIFFGWARWPMKTIYLWERLSDRTAHYITLRIVSNCPRGWCSERNHPWVSEDGLNEKHDAINYRPISLTCISCKILEHVKFASSVMFCLESNNILYDLHILQHGLRSSRSCETQLISFIQDLSQSNNNNKQTDIIIMDFAKAFDKVSHKHLLYKLEYYGITCNAHKWISDFLTQRTQTVVLESVMSDKVHAASGVPQATVLGPILFLIYTKTILWWQYYL